MAWIDDRIWCHPKFTEVTDQAAWTWVKSVAYSTGFQTHGHLTAGQQRAIGVGVTERDELLAAGLWDESENGAVVIHDWDEHNSKRDARRSADRDRKRRQRAKERGETVDEPAVAPPTDEAVPRPSRVTPPVTLGVTARVDGSEGSDGSEGDQETAAVPESSNLPVAPARELVIALSTPSPATQNGKEPAAADRPVTDREVTDLVSGLRGADKDSPARIIPLAHGFPRQTFVEIFETVCQRRAENPVGLLTHLLRIRRAEWTAALSAQLNASLATSGRAYVPAPWMSEVVRAEEPERYVRLMAKTLTDGDLRESLRAHGDRVDVLLALAARVRAGDEPTAERYTPEQERTRWVERHAATDPLAEVAAVIDGWDDVDPLERQALHERAEQIRDECDAKREAA